MKKNIQIGILSSDPSSSEFIAKSWGKKGTTSDISLYTISTADFIQTTVVPFVFPKKKLPMVIAAHMADLILIAIPNTGIDTNIGEIALLCDTLNSNGLVAVVGENAAGMEYYFDKLDKMFAKLNIINWEKIMITSGKEISDAKNHFYDLYDSMSLHENSGDDLAIIVDHAFPVQGVGSVILGTVTSGTVTKGEKIVIYPENQKGIVRSIQVNDVDKKEAESGTRVGLAIKGILPKYLNRGTIITREGSSFVEETNNIEKLKIKLAAFGEFPEVGSKIHVVSGLFDSPAEITSKENNRISFKSDKKVPYYKGIKLSLLDLNKKPFVLGTSL